MYTCYSSCIVYVYIALMTGAGGHGVLTGKTVHARTIITIIAAACIPIYIAIYNSSGSRSLTFVETKSICTDVECEYRLYCMLPWQH